MYFSSMQKVKMDCRRHEIHCPAVNDQTQKSVTVFVFSQIVSLLYCMTDLNDLKKKVLYYVLGRISSFQYNQTTYEDVFLMGLGPSW